MKWLVSLAVLALTGGAAGWFWQHRQGGGTEYLTAAVARGDLTQLVTATGTLNPVLNVQVGSQISGNIQKLFADYNSPVKAGQTVAQIDPAVYQAAVMQAEGELASARAALELAQINERRTRELRGKDVSSPADLDQAVASLHAAEANVQIREGALVRARVDVEHCTITSPVDGIVISRSVDVGQTVAASLSAPVIFTIANDLSKMQIDANVAEADVGSVAVEQEVDFTVDAFPFRTFLGKVIQVRNAPLTVQNVVTYDCVIAVDNAEGKLKPGMTANVSIVIARRPNALMVSNAALRFHPPETSPAPGSASRGPQPLSGRGGAGGGGARGPGGGQGRRAERTVYVLPEGASATPRPAQVKLGISNGIATEVLEGLNEGDRVVTASVGGASAANAAAGGPPGAGNNNPLGGGRRF